MQVQDPTPVDIQIQESPEAKREAYNWVKNPRVGIKKYIWQDEKNKLLVYQSKWVKEEVIWKILREAITKNSQKQGDWENELKNLG